jgi:hypothetical protein
MVFGTVYSPLQNSQSNSLKCLIRMYEAKKQIAEKTIEKKDAKLKEINNILAEEINPTLSKLKEERAAYLGVHHV